MERGESNILPGHLEVVRETMNRTYRMQSEANYKEKAEELSSRHVNGEMVPLEQLLAEVGLENTRGNPMRLARLLLAEPLKWRKQTQVFMPADGKRRTLWQPPVDADEDDARPRLVQSAIDLGATETSRDGSALKDFFLGYLPEDCPICGPQMHLDLKED